MGCTHVYTLGFRKNMLNLPLDTDMIKNKLGDILPTVRKMKSEFEDPNLTTFVCVCIAEFLCN